MLSILRSMLYALCSVIYVLRPVFRIRGPGFSSPALRSASTAHRPSDVRVCPAADGRVNGLILRLSFPDLG